MGKQKRKPQIDHRGPLQRLLDNEAVADSQSRLDVLTGAQIASGDYAPIGGRRYFRLQHIGRLHRNEKLTYEQHQAGVWYRTQYDMGRYDGTKVMALDRTEGGNVVGFDFMERVQDARDRWRAARIEIPHDIVGFMDRLLLRDEWPQSRQQRARNAHLSTTRRGLDALVRHLRLPC